MEASPPAPAPAAPLLSRRAVVKGAAALLGASAVPGFLPVPPAEAQAAPAPPSTGTSGAPVEWVVTTASSPWQRREGLVAQRGGGMPGVIVQTGSPLQVVDGFGACFNELGWTSLSALASADREGIFRELFAPGAGACFTTCRMPIGANDFSRDWYSYDEVDGDFALEHFTIENDLQTLVPFVEAALAHQPALKIWASPWSPPTWMKVNKHYAMSMPMPARPGSDGVQNGLRPDQVGKEGTDLFVQEERYFLAYAAYFGRFIDEYKKQGITVGMVMPQNEFNSAQVFPSCCWTAGGLARFLAYLGPEMEKRGVAVFFGTMERPNEKLVEVSLQDPAAGRFVKGVGFQWAGKGAIGAIRRRYPDLTLYQTEQECGDGRNDWRYARYAWSLMKHYFRNGAGGYFYWNISLKKGGVSRWGWAQNSLVVVDTDARTFAYTHEYHLMKHLSHFVRPGARYVETASWTGYENQIAFVNPDGSVVVLIQNDMSEPMTVGLRVGDVTVTPTLPADSFSTIVVRG